MADINNQTIYAEDVDYVITYTSSRPDNGHMTYDFTINATLDEERFLVVNVALLCTITINGTSGQVYIKESQYSWAGGVTRERTVSVTCNSTVGDETQTVTFEVVSDGSYTTTTGVISNSAYTVTSLQLLTTACTAPTSCAVDIAVAETSAVLAWSGASGGVNNSISAYEIQYSDSSDGSTWGSWTALDVISSTDTSGTLSVSPPSTRGYYRRFRVRTCGSAGEDYYSDWKISSNSVRRNLWPVQPTSVTASPASYTSESITVTWSGASSPTSAIKGYMIARRTSTDNTAWSSWSVMAIFNLAATGGSRIETPLYVPGIYIQYGVWTIDAFDIYSSEEISNSVFCALTFCGAPTECDVSATLAENDVILEWSGASGGVGNYISAYEVQYSESTDGSTWGEWMALDIISSTSTSGSLSVSPSSTRGNYRRFRVRTRGSISEAGYSGWTVSNNSVRRKRLPPAPDIAAPVSGSSIYNATPRVIITTGVEPDGQTQVVEIQLDSSIWYNSVDNEEYFSTSGALSDNTSTVFLCPELSTGTHSVIIRCYDSLIKTRGAEVSLTFTILSLSLEDITANITHVKAAHILALRAAVNDIRGYYGFASISWSTAITAGKTQIRDWPYHILEVRKAISAVVIFIRSYGSTTDFGVPSFDWISFGTKRPRADVMNQLRGLITTL